MGICTAHKVNFLLAALKLPSRWSPNAYFQAFMIFLNYFLTSLLNYLSTSQHFLPLWILTEHLDLLFSLSDHFFFHFHGRLPFFWLPLKF